MKVEQTISQDVINAKLFENLEKIDERIERFEAKIMAQMNWQPASDYGWFFGKCDHILGVYS
jgi:hypothetical protein